MQVSCLCVVVFAESSAVGAGCGQGRRFLGAVCHLAQHQTHFGVECERVE